ncbi:hypothetical protein BK026_11955 [Alteromonas sp. V450]|uniref:glycosyltransferase family 61 protein n=1 Tax=Alteromonas sp. V450 TaxID=1912139 RepID=UPI0008FF50CA|nr:glycosyltransferase family 61 protein [Alteromonas sp. V450]OJF69441.1 hypothetical protein BK026_11955 [Alteromonas sp. V450]
MNDFSFNLRVAEEQDVVRLRLIEEITPTHDITFFEHVDAFIDDGVDAYSAVKQHWAEQTTKFLTRKKYTESDGVAKKYDNTLKIYRMTGGIIFPISMFASNFDGIIPKETVLGPKVFKNKMINDVEDKNEWASIALGKKELKTLPTELQFSSKRVIKLSSALQRNYYHWMVECLPKLGVFKNLLAQPSSLKIVVDHKLPAFVMSSLELFGIRQENLINIRRVTAFSEVIFSSRLSQSNVTISPYVRTFYKDFSAKFLKPMTQTVTTAKRIYISRSKASMRRIVNEDALVEMLRSFGFTIVANEDYSLIEQAQLFHDADVVMGAHGAGLTNILFCRENTKVIELLHHEFDQGVTSYAALSELFDLQYKMYVGKAIHDEKQSWNANLNFSVNVKQVKAILSKLL